MNRLTELGQSIKVEELLINDYDILYSPIVSVGSVNIPRVKIEVEEEEEQQREQSHQQQVLLELATKNSQQQSSNHHHHTKPTDVSHLQHLTNQSPHSGGLIRLPPQHSSSSSASSNWRRDQIQHQGQQKQEANPRYTFGTDSQSNLIHDSDNPAWRGVPNPEAVSYTHLTLPTNREV